MVAEAVGMLFFVTIILGLKPFSENVAPFAICFPYH